MYAAFGTLAVVLALFSAELRQIPLSEPLLALALGVVVGPELLALVTMDEALRDRVLLEGSRLLLAGSVMSAALRFPATRLRPLLGPVTVLVRVVMPLAAAVVAGAAALVLGLPLAVAALVGACLAPTDPVLAASVVSGEASERDLPERLRQLLTAESGANDGLALPLVGLALAAVLPATGPSDAALRLAWEVACAGLVGVVAGAGAGWSVRAATRHHSLGHGPALVFSLLLAVAVLGLARLAATDGVLAVFAAGLAYNRVVGPDRRGPEEDVDEAVNRYAVLPLFLVLGAVLPWADWVELGWEAAVFVGAVLFLRRLPAVVALARALGLRGRDAVFAGWFGPMGMSAVFYLAHSAEKGAADPRLFAVGTLAVAASVVAFGVSASPGRKAYARLGGDR